MLHGRICKRFSTVKFHHTTLSTIRTWQYGTSNNKGDMFFSWNNQAVFHSINTNYVLFCIHCCTVSEDVPSCTSLLISFLLCSPADSEDSDLWCLKGMLDFMKIVFFPFLVFYLNFYYKIIKFINTKTAHYD